jgi:Zn-dependent metalloprotease
MLTLVSVLSLFSPGTTPSMAASIPPENLISKVTLSGGIDAAALHALNEKDTAGKRPLKKSTTGVSNRVDPTLIGEQLKKALEPSKRLSRKSLRTPLITENQQNNLRSLTSSTQDSGDVHVQFDRKNGTPALIKGKAITPGKPGARGDIASMESIARKFVVDNRNLLKISNPMKELKIKRHWADKIGKKHFRYQQTVNSIPIFGKELMVHLDKENSVYPNVA